MRIMATLLFCLLAFNGSAIAKHDDKQQCRHDKCESTASWWVTDESKRDPRYYKRKDNEED